MKSSSQNPILLVVLAIFVLASGSIAAVGDTLSVGSSSGLPGTSGHIIPINLRNVTAVKALLFKVKDVPDSLTVTGVVGTSRASGYRAEMTAVGGTVKILMFPTDGSTPMIAAGTGTIANLTVSVNASAPGGSKATLSLDSVRVAGTTNQAVTVYTKNGYFWYGTKGDVKYDGSINLFDVLRLIDIALNRQPTPTEYERWAGDLNSDGVIDVVDISLAIDLAVAATPRVLVDEDATETLGTAELQMPALPQNFKGQVAIPLTVKADAPVSGLQFSFKLDPRRFLIAQPQMTDLSKNMSVAIHTVNDQVHVMVYSLSGDPLPAGEGTVLQLPITIAEPLASPEKMEITSAMAGSVGGSKLQALFGQSSTDVANAPGSYALMQNTPNPFNMSTKITYEVPSLKAGGVDVQLVIYNAQGQVVRTLEDLHRAPGRYTVNWDGRDDAGSYVSSGVYFYKMTADNVVLTKKLAVTK